VRTTGCNLRCSWCDTEYAFYGGEELSIAEILAQVKCFDCKLVEITGGEPLLQKQVPELAKQLLDLGYKVLIETSGERDISVLDKRVIKIMDLKCPGSDESHRNRWENIPFLTKEDEVKFVIKNREDYDWSVEVLKKHELQSKTNILFSPVFGELDLPEIIKWILKDKLQVRFQLQMHKIIWSPEKQSV